VYKKRGAVAASEASPHLIGCDFCPEVFADSDAASLHEGIHDNPISEGYVEWKKRLDETFSAKGAPPLTRTRSQGRRMAVMGL
jgi:hypothetical protein